MTTVSLYKELDAADNVRPRLRYRMSVCDLFRSLVVVKVVPNFYVPMWMYLIPPLAFWVWMSGKSWSRLSPDVYIIRWGRLRFLPTRKVVVSHRELLCTLRTLADMGYVDFIEKTQAGFPTTANVREAIAELERSFETQVQLRTLAKRSSACS